MLWVESRGQDAGYTEHILLKKRKLCKDSKEARIQPLGELSRVKPKPHDGQEAVRSQCCLRGKTQNRVTAQTGDIKNLGSRVKTLMVGSHVRELKGK